MKFDFNEIISYTPKKFIFHHSIVSLHSKKIF